LLETVEGSPEKLVIFLDLGGPFKDEVFENLEVPVFDALTQPVHEDLPFLFREDVAPHEGSPVSYLNHNAYICSVIIVITSPLGERWGHPQPRSARG